VVGGKSALNRRIVRIVATALIVGAWCGASMADEFRDWQNTPVGSWRKEREIRETIDRQTGKATDVTSVEAHKTLVESSDDSVTLQIAATSVVAGKTVKLDSTVVLRADGADEGETAVVEKLEPAEVIVDGKKRKCRRTKSTVRGPRGQRVITTSLNEGEFPFLLRRSTETSDSEGAPVLSVVEEATALDMPHRLQNEVVTTAHFRTVMTNHKTKTTAVTIRSGEIPGAVVAAWSKEADENGNVLRRTTTEILQFEKALPQPTGFGARARERREQRNQRRGRKP
jgi:hypothetical protein